MVYYVTLIDKLGLWDKSNIQPKGQNLTAFTFKLITMEQCRIP